METYYLNRTHIRNLLFSASAPHPGSSEYYLLAEIYKKYASSSKIPSTLKLTNSYSRKTVAKALLKLGFKISNYSRIYGKTKFKIYPI